MNHSCYQLALLRRDELLRKATGRRLARHTTAATRSPRSRTFTFHAHQLRLTARPRPAAGQ